MKQLFLFLLFLGCSQTIFSGTPSSSPAVVRLAITNGSFHSANAFGYVAGATKCVDAALGELELPPKPPDGFFDVRFFEPSCPPDVMGMTNSYHGLQDTVTSDTFHLLIQAGDPKSAVVVQWSPDSISGFSSLTMLEPGGEKAIRIDLLTDKKLILQPGTSSLGLTIVAHRGHPPTKATTKRRRRSRSNINK